jgi:hypothetical protein
MTKDPLSLVTAETPTPVFTFVATTFAPTTTASDGSATRPAIAARDS